MSTNKAKSKKSAPKKNPKSAKVATAAAPKKAKKGRPPGNPENVLSKQTMIRLTPKDEMDFGKEAERLGKEIGAGQFALSQYLRMAGRAMIGKLHGSVSK